MNLFVARLSSSTTGDDLQDIFSQYGEVTSAKVVIDRETGNSKGFGFVEMSNDDEAQEAIKALNESELDGKEIVVKQANPRDENAPRKSFPPRRGGGGGGNFGNRGGDGGGYPRRDDRRGSGGGGGGGGARRPDNRNRGGGGGGYESNDRW